MIRDTAGPGVPFILLHALSMDGSMFREIYPSLSKTARGFGHLRSSRHVSQSSATLDWPFDYGRET